MGRHLALVEGPPSFLFVVPRMFFLLSVIAETLILHACQDMEIQVLRKEDKNSLVMKRC